jgi:neutral ceramidase
MSGLQGGFGSVAITPHNLGLRMMGYGTREHGTRIAGSEGIHDPLWARALVLSRGESAWVLCTLDLFDIDGDAVGSIRRRVNECTGLAHEAISVAAIHTHSGPSSLDADNWTRPFSTIVADAVLQAWENRRPVRLASGAGFLYGHSINRRWLDRPIDPGVGVLRVDDDEGEVLGIVVNFGLHAVVLGSDNLLISADYVGYARDAVENAMGGTCLFTNGGAADVNPMTETLRQQMAGQKPVVTMTGARYYGDGPDAVFIEERKGGSFEEAQYLGHALAEETIRVSRGLKTGSPATGPWCVQAWVNHLADGEELIETQAFGIGDFALVAQPGDVFAETALRMKARLRSLGFRFPWLVSYANGAHSYLAPRGAYEEGGYEVEQARLHGHAEDLQERLWTGIGDQIPSRKS